MCVCLEIYIALLKKRSKAKQTKYSYCFLLTGQVYSLSKEHSRNKLGGAGQIIIEHNKPSTTNKT